MKILAKTKDLSHEEWLKYRTQGIGGSDVSILAGINPFKSVHQLWLEKTGQVELEESDTEYTHFGTLLEPIVRKEFTTRTGIKVRQKHMILQSEEYPFMTANLDGTINDKNNGTSFIGITISGTENQAQPIVYLDGYYNMFLHSKLSLKEVSDTVYDVIMEHMNYVPNVKITDLMNWNQMKSKICVKLINAEQNRELLTDMPHRFYLDFAVVYYIKISERGDELETMDVKNKYLDMWGISEEELYRTGIHCISPFHM